MCAQGVGVHSRPISGIVVCGGEVDEWAGGSGAGGWGISGRGMTSVRRKAQQCRLLGCKFK